MSTLGIAMLVYYGVTALVVVAIMAKDETGKDAIATLISTAGLMGIPAWALYHLGLWSTQ